MLRQVAVMAKGLQLLKPTFSQGEVQQKRKYLSHPQSSSKSHDFSLAQMGIMCPFLKRLLWLQGLLCFPRATLV